MALLRDSLLAHDAIEEGRPVKETEAVRCKCGKIVHIKLDVGEEKVVTCSCGHVMLIKVVEEQAA